MSLIQRLLVFLRKCGHRREGFVPDRLERLHLETLAHAHGAWLALLATILEREQILTSEQLARSLADIAALTAADRPAEGQILSFWASRLQDTASSFRDLPSVH